MATFGIDGRLWYESGVGRYIRNLVNGFDQIKSNHKFVIFLNSKAFNEIEFKNLNFKKVKADSKWHTLDEQIKFKKVIEKENVDLMHFPYFSYPVFYKKPFVITIHDLIIDHFPTGKSSSLPSLFYDFKRLAYKKITKNAVKKAEKIIVPSKATLQELEDHYRVDPKKVEVIYEGFDKLIGNKSKKKELVSNNYILYVGNAYPHKNLERLMKAYKKLKETENIDLIFIGRKDFFYEKLQDKISDGVYFLHNVDDRELFDYYTNAKCIVVPSLMEGFGLPLLEGMSLSCPVISSNTKALKEIGGDACLYFDPENYMDMHDCIKKIINDKSLRKSLIQKGLKQSSKFNWENCINETLKYMKVAIVYDRVNKIGGAERVLQTLGEIFPHATLYTSVYNKDKTPWANKFKVKTSFLQKIPFLNSKHEFIPYLMPMAFESFDFTGFDLVISVTSEAAKGIIVPLNTHHVCICLTPTRYLWSGYHEYFKNFFLRIVTGQIVSYLRGWDLLAAKKPDVMIAISQNVKERIKKYYKRDSVVIYPPSDRLLHQKIKEVEIPEKDYFLVVSRLVDYKRVDLAVKACTKLNLPLVVIGEGSEWEKLDTIAHENVIFKGKVSDQELISYYKNCKALIFPGEEDFGITMVEANLFGKPVIAYKKGGALEIIQNNKTGLFFDKQTVASLTDVLKKFKKFRYNSNYCKNNAKRFSEVKFKKDFLKFLTKNKYI